MQQVGFHQDGSNFIEPSDEPKKDIDIQRGQAGRSPRDGPLYIGLRSDLEVDICAVVTPGCDTIWHV